MSSKIKERCFGNSTCVLLILVTLFTLFGCVTYIWWEPIEWRKPIKLFDRYSLQVGGCALHDRTYRFTFDIEFIDTVYSTVLLDTVPILVIDQLCFEADCIDIPIYERTILEYKRPLDPNNPDSLPFKPPTVSDDIWDCKDYLSPVDFMAMNNIKLPHECREITIKFTARLLDRVTGEEIEREQKNVPMELNKEKRLQMR